jgi:hypothetical protein
MADMSASPATNIGWTPHWWIPTTNGQWISPPDERSSMSCSRCYPEHVVLPEEGIARRYRHVLTGELIHAEHVLPAAAVFRTMPVAMLWAPASP